MLSPSSSAITKNVFFFFLFYKFLFCHHAFHLILKNKKSSTYRKYVEDDKLPWYHLMLDAKASRFIQVQNIYLILVTAERGCLLKIIVQHTSRKPIPYIAPHGLPPIPALCNVSNIRTLLT